MSGRRRRPWRPPRCSSGKASYRTQGDALRAVVVIRRDAAQAVASSDTIPVGAYRCRECKAWHLTSSAGGTTVMAP